MNLITKSIGLLGIAGIATITYAVQSGRQLVIDGKVSSIRVDQQEGHYCVPLSDIATYFGYTMSVTGDQAVLTKIAKPITDSGVSARVDTYTGPMTAGGTGFANAPGGSALSYAQADPTVGDPAVSMPSQISVVIGKAASVDGVDYTVTSIDDVGAKYKEIFDQRQVWLQPRWKSDSLVVLNITETNQSTVPIQARFPSAADITVFDGKKMGYQATGLDFGRPSGVISSGSSDLSTAYDDTGSASNPILGPGGKIQFAVIASVPTGDRVTSVIMKIGGVTSGAQALPATIITILRS